MFASCADFSEAMQPLESLPVEILATLAEFRHFLDEVAFAILGLAQRGAEVGQLLPEVLRILVEVGEVHAFGNGDLDGLAALDACDDEPRATVVDDQSVAAVGAVKDDVGLADFAALVVDVRDHAGLYLCTFDVVVFVH